MRYHSFVVYFSMLQRLGWVEPTGQVEISQIKEYYRDWPERRYYRLTKKGRDAADTQWSNPLFVLYPETFLKHHPILGK